MLYFSILAGMLFSTALALVVAFLLWLLLSPFDRVDTNLIVRAFVFPPVLFRPELAEKAQYVAGLIIFPLALYLSQKFFLERLRRMDSRSRSIRYALLSATAVILVGALCTLDFMENPFYLSGYGGSGLPAALASCLALAALAYAYLFLEDRLAVLKKISGAAFTMASLALIMAVVLLNIFSKYYVSESIIFLAFNAFFYPVSQVFAGKALLVDLTDQYGLYPHFLEPIFRLTGLSVLSFTLVMAALLGLSYLCMFLFLRSAVRSKAVALLGFIAVVALGYCAYAASGDPYFQFFPHRLLFPSLLILLSWAYFNYRRKWVYYLAFFVFALGVLWNLETGLVVYLAWVLALMYDGLTRPGARLGQQLPHVKNGLLCLSAVVLAYTAYIYLRYGSFPDFVRFFYYQAFYYGFGFFMLPMKPIHPWNLAILAYMVGIAYSVRSLALKDHSPRSSSIFLLSVLGAGVFVYFQGRSHDSVLLLVIYPALLLLTLFTDDLLAIRLRAKKIRAHQLLLLFLSLAILASALTGLAQSAGILHDIGQQRQGTLLAGGSTEVTDGIEFIKGHTHPGEAVLIVSYNAGVYHAETGTASPVDTPGLSEIILAGDMGRIADFLANRSHEGDKVFLDTFYLEHYGFDDANNIIIRTLFRDYRAVAGSPDNGIILFEKCPDDLKYSIDLMSAGSGEALFYCAYDAGAYAYRDGDDTFLGFAGRTMKGNVTLPDNYTIELVVEPREEAAGATLLSNHRPGSGEGFTIRRSDGGDNAYEYVIGDGHDPAHTLKFDLDEGSARHLAITARNGSLSAYVDGRLAGCVDHAVPVKNTDSGLAIGNDPLLQRPFNGTIREIRITDDS